MAMLVVLERASRPGALWQLGASADEVTRRDEEPAIAPADLTADGHSGHHNPTPPRRRFDVAIEAYVRMSFNDEIELTGYIGDAAFTAASRSRRRTTTVSGEVGGMAANLSIGGLRLRHLPVKGEVMGQPVSGSLVVRHGSLVFTGMAGEEPLRYRIDGQGACSNHDLDLGIRVVAQAFYSEIIGGVDRIPDAAMIGLLLPVRLARQDDAYG